MTTSRVRALLGLLALGACKAGQAATVTISAAVAAEAAPPSARQEVHATYAPDAWLCGGVFFNATEA